MIRYDIDTEYDEVDGTPYTFITEMTDGKYVLAEEAEAAEQRIVAMQQILDTLGAQEDVPRLIELAIAANDLMYANGQRDEAAKHHANQCCRVCDTHVMPHRGCILR
jgi:predicted metal-dependent HD superfamily phosphohydrolase